MKLLVVFALVCVCSAEVLEQPKTSVDLVKDTFWDYVAKATQMAEDSLKQLQASELGQDVNNKLSQSVDTVNQYVVALKAQAAPLSQELLTQITQQSEALKTRVESELSAAANLQPYAEQLVRELQTKIDELKTDVTPFIEAMDAEALKSVMSQKIQELRSSLQSQMGPYTDDMRQKVEQTLEEFQTGLMPLTQGFESQLNQKIQEVQQNLAPLGEELRAKAESNAEDMKTKIIALWESFVQKPSQ